MKTQMNNTSLDAYHSLPVAGYLQPREREIMAQFTSPDIQLSRKQLARLTGLELSCVCGRVNSLVTKNALVVRGHGRDPQTGKTQELVGLPVADQGALFGKVA